MWRASIVIALSISSIGQDPAPQPAVRDRYKESAPDPSWVPKPGDTATVLKDATIGSPDYSAYRETRKFAEAGDGVGLAKVAQSKAFVRLDRGTEVLVLKVYRPGPDRVATYVGGTDAAYRRMQQAILDNYDPTVYPVEVRVASGPHKDRAVVVAEDAIGRLVPREFPKGYTYTPPGSRIGTFVEFPGEDRSRSRAKKSQGPGDPVVRAENLMRTARRLEKSDAARSIAAYLHVVWDYPQTGQAKAAQSRLDELGLRETDEGRLILEPRPKGRR